jgi:hypothetical protein
VRGCRVWHARGQTSAWPERPCTSRCMASAPAPGLTRHRQPDPSAVEVAAPTPAVGLGPELPLKLHQAPDPGAVGADVRLDVDGRLTDGDQVDAEQLRAPPRSAGLSPGRASSPPNRGIEHMFESESRTLRSLTRQLRACTGRAGAATRRNLGDSNGQQETTDVEVSSHFTAFTWHAKPWTALSHSRGHWLVRHCSALFKAGPAGGRLRRPS